MRCRSPASGLFRVGSRLRGSYVQGYMPVGHHPDRSVRPGLAIQPAPGSQVAGLGVGHDDDFDTQRVLPVVTRSTAQTHRTAVNCHDRPARRHRVSIDEHLIPRNGRDCRCGYGSWRRHWYFYSASLLLGRDSGRPDPQSVWTGRDHSEHVLLPRFSPVNLLSLFPIQ